MEQDEKDKTDGNTKKLDVEITHKFEFEGDVDDDIPIEDEGVSYLWGDTKLKTIFKDVRIAGLAGVKNSAKTNNLIHMVRELRETGNEVPIYAYGLPPALDPVYEMYHVTEISCLEQLVYKQNCLIILDEFQKLKLNDRRSKDTLNSLIDFIYHRNVYLLLSSPNIREFNSIIGGVIEKWLIKTIRIDQCINGSQLKKVISNYSGRFKVLNNIVVPKNKLLVINDERELVFDCPYEEIADNKKSNPSIF